MFKFFGRKEELGEFISEKTKKLGSLYVIKGRRRIGKSELIKEFSRKNNFNLICIQGLGIKDSKKLNKTQIQNFCELAQIELNDISFNYDNWNMVFYQLAERLKYLQKEKRTVILIDEISWMAGDNNELLEKFKTAWDNYFQYQNVCIFLCGSVSSWIEKNIVTDTSFVARITKTVTIEELVIEDAKLFWEELDTNPKTRLKCLFLTGGVAKYLQEIDKNLSAEQNIQKLCFSKNGFLLNEFDNFFKDSFNRQSKLYKKIMYLLINGKMKQSEITKATGNSDLTEVLDELKQAGFLKEESNFSFNPASDPKDKFYTIKDNYSIFYLKYIEPYRSRINKGIYKNNKALEKFPQWKIISGLLFENIIKKNLHLILEEMQLNMESVLNYDSYIGRKGKDIPTGFQIDLLIEDVNNNLYLCEFKMRQEIGLEVETEVKNKIKKLEKKLRKKYIR